MRTLAEYLTADHARLEALLESSLEDPHSYTEFRRGLLKHIAIEEKILFPILKEITEYRERLVTLRAQHGALGALLVPRLTTGILQAIIDILEVHDALEEGTAGIYSHAERLALNSGKDLLPLALAITDVPLSPAIDKLEDIAPVARAVARAGFEPSRYFALP
jgi:hypothetical protein